MSTRKQATARPMTAHRLIREIFSCKDHRRRPHSDLGLGCLDATRVTARLATASREKEKKKKAYALEKHTKRHTAPLRQRATPFPALNRSQ